MVDGYGWFSIIVRTIALIIFLDVLFRQYRELRRKDNGLLSLKIRLTITVVLLLSANILSLVLNFYRQPDGNLLAHARQTGMVLNAIATLAVADSFRAIYKYSRNN